MVARTLPVTEDVPGFQCCGAEPELCECAQKESGPAGTNLQGARLSGASLAKEVSRARLPSPWLEVPRLAAADATQGGEARRGTELPKWAGEGIPYPLCCCPPGTRLQPTRCWNQGMPPNPRLLGQVHRIHQGYAT